MSFSNMLEILKKKNKGMHKACLDVQKAMKHCKNIWAEYYILKMDVRKFFKNIN